MYELAVGPALLLRIGPGHESSRCHTSSFRFRQIRKIKWSYDVVVGKSERENYRHLFKEHFFWQISCIGAQVTTHERDVGWNRGEMRQELWYRWGWQWMHSDARMGLSLIRSLFCLHRSLTLSLHLHAALADSLAFELVAWWNIFVQF